MPATGMTYKTLVDELSRVIGDPDIATTLVDKAEFPTRLRPNAGTPLGFWGTVIREARNGAGDDGVFAIACEACALYRSNSTFRTCLDELQSRTELWVLSIEIDDQRPHSGGDLVAVIKSLGKDKGLRLHCSSPDGARLVLELTADAAARLSSLHAAGELSGLLNTQCWGFKICQDQRALLVEPSSDEPKDHARVGHAKPPEPRALAPLQREQLRHQHQERALAPLDEHHERALRDPQVVARVIQFSLGYPLGLVMVTLAWLAGLIGGVPEAVFFSLLLGTLAGALLATLSSNWWTTLENERCKAIRARYEHARGEIGQYGEFLRSLGMPAEEVDAMLIDRYESLLDRVLEELTDASSPGDPPQ